MTFVPFSRARVAGWMGGAFLFGILLHSFAPYRFVSFRGLSFIAGGIGCLFALTWRRERWRVGLLCLLMVVLGVWRFAAAAPQMPPRLVPLNPEGLAFVLPTKTPPNDWRAWLFQGRASLTDRARTIFSADEGALLTGILYGDRNLSKETKQNFRRAGLLHIIAVSGSNVTIVVVLISQFLLLLRFSRRAAFFALSGGLFLFVIFVNPSASVVRAALMGWLVELAPLTGRIPTPSRLLLVAAVIFVGWQPWALLYDASFALSFLAMWGLLTWGAWLDARWRAILPWTGLRSILCATIAATIMVTPYSAWAFGQFSLWGLVTSLVVLPLIPWTMLTGSLALLLPSVQPLVWSARGFLEIILWVARWPSLLPFGSWDRLTVSPWVMIVLYTSLYLFWMFLQPKNRLSPTKIHFFNKNCKAKPYSKGGREKIERESTSRHRTNFFCPCSM